MEEGMTTVVSQATQRTYLASLDAAMTRSRAIGLSEYETRLPFDPTLAVDLSAVREKVVEDFSDGWLKDSRASPGRCYLVARDLSYSLLKLKIPHAITIGNVLLDGAPYFTTTLASLRADLDDGYSANEPANAHCWLTLLDGSIVDGTLNASIAHQEGAAEPLSFEQAVYAKRHDEEDRLAYVPLLTGFHYHMRVVTNPYQDRHYETYMRWFLDYRKCAQSDWWKVQTGRA
jgi:hypothetical protein